MSKLERLLFGRVAFSESEEFQAFRFRFLCIVLVSGAICTALFLIGEHTKVNRIEGPHLVSMSVFTAGALLLWLLLRGQKNRFLPVAWIYEALCLLEYISALLFVPRDELRVLWFLINIPGVYILLGQKAGAAITALTAAGLALGNPHLSVPYSPNGLATLLISTLYMGVFFHVYGNRAISYFVRMNESNRQLRYMASHDTLTGVLNARAYYSRCDQMIRLALRNHTPYAVLFVDLDHFKSINDTHGHAVGDIVLKSVAGALSDNIRDSDALGRIGGEEFSIFLPNTDQRGAVELAEKLRRIIEGLMPSTGEQRIRITASIGVAINRHGEQSMLDIQQHADQAMYQAKAQGRNRVSCFEELPELEQYSHR